MSSARFEAMRAAMDARYGLWAVAMATQAHQPEADARKEAEGAIRQLIAEGHLYLFRAPWAWGDELVLEGEAAEEAFADEKNWRPRRINSRRLARVGATEKGRRAFLSHEFGYPEPIDISTSFENLELQGITAAEGFALFLAIGGFALGAWVGMLVAGIIWRGGLTIAGAYIMFLGGIVGLGAAVAGWRRLSPKVAATTLPPNVIPDSYMGGPTLNPNDEFGNPRF